MHILQLKLKDFDARRTGLIDLVMDAVAHGASIGFLRSLERDEADAYWGEVRLAMLHGGRVVWCAERNGKLVGTVQLDPCPRKNGRNRAELQKLIVHSGARRLGVGAALMRAVEAAAVLDRRGLVYFDTEAGSVADAFYRACGYTYAGGLPEYACGPDGNWSSNAIFYKTLFLRSEQ